MGKKQRRPQKRKRLINDYDKKRKISKKQNDHNF